MNFDLLISSTIIVSVLTFCVQFFGRIMSDRKSFIDDRNWEIVVSGVAFLIFIIGIPALIGIAMASYFGNRFFCHLTNLILIILCFYFLWRYVVLLENKIYGINFQIIFKDIKIGNKVMTSKEIKNFFDSIDNIAVKIPLLIYPVLFAYILTIEYQANNDYWLIANGLLVFINLIFLALAHSLQNTRLLKVNILFNNSANPILGATLFRFNKDNIRIKKEDKNIVINKDVVERIEFL